MASLPPAISRPVMRRAAELGSNAVAIDSPSMLSFPRRSRPVRGGRPSAAGQTFSWSEAPHTRLTRASAEWCASADQQTAREGESVMSGKPVTLALVVAIAAATLGLTMANAFAQKRGQEELVNRVTPFVC